MEKHSVIYTEPRTFGKYDENNIIGYLDEEVVPEYLPEGAENPTIGYKYTGPEKDGGTIMPCKDSLDYGLVTNAIIRAKITDSEEQAIQRHYINDPETYQQEWDNYNEICENAKALAKMWIGIK